MPIILNQDNVVLDGHHQLKACKELGIPITYSTKDFMNRPLDELKFVVSVNRRVPARRDWAEDEDSSQKAAERTPFLLRAVFI